MNIYAVRQILQFWSEKYRYYTINSANKEDAVQSACMLHQNQCLRKMSRKNLQTYRYYTINSANNLVDLFFSFFCGIDVACAPTDQRLLCSLNL